MAEKSFARFSNYEKIYYFLEKPFILNFSNICRSMMDVSEIEFTSKTTLDSFLYAIRTRN